MSADVVEIGPILDRSTSEPLPTWVDLELATEMAQEALRGKPWDEVAYLRCERWPARLELKGTVPLHELESMQLNRRRLMSHDEARRLRGLRGLHVLLTYRGMGDDGDLKCGVSIFTAFPNIRGVEAAKETL